MHHSGGTGYGTGPQERVHQAPRAAGQPDKCPYETYQAQIPDCCAAAAAVQDPYPRPPSGYDGRCYDECHRRTPYQEDAYPQVRSVVIVWISWIVCGGVEGKNVTIRGTILLIEDSFQEGIVLVSIIPSSSLTLRALKLNLIFGL